MSEEINLQIIAIAAVVALVVYGVKSSERVSSNYLPLVSLALGALFGYIVGIYFKNPALGALEGFIAGGFASGGYDSVMSLLALFTNKKKE